MMMLLVFVRMLLYFLQFSTLGLLLALAGIEQRSRDGRRSDGTRSSKRSVAGGVVLGLVGHDCFMRLAWAGFKGLASNQFAHIGKPPGDSGSRSHRRRDEVRARAGALPADEVAVAGRSAAFARRNLVGVHAETR